MTVRKRKYHAGETDAILRRFRRYLYLIDDGEISSQRKQHLTAVITEDFRALDEFLSSGRPLPAVWEKGRNGAVKVARVATQKPEPETAGSGKSRTKKEGK